MLIFKAAVNTMIWFELAHQMLIYTIVSGSHLSVLKLFIPSLTWARCYRDIIISPTADPYMSITGTDVHRMSIPSTKSSYLLTCTWCLTISNLVLAIHVGTVSAEADIFWKINSRSWGVVRSWHHWLNKVKGNIWNGFCNQEIFKP